MKISRSKRKRARAVADFERKDDDELGNIWRINWMKTFDGYHFTIHEKLFSHSIDDLKVLEKMTSSQLFPNEMNIVG